MHPCCCSPWCAHTHRLFCPLWGVIVHGLWGYIPLAVSVWCEMASAAAWSPAQPLLAACGNFMEYTQPGNKMWLYQKSILTWISRLCHCYSIRQQQMHFECVFCQVKLQIYPFLSLCIITYRIITFKSSKVSDGKKSPKHFTQSIQNNSHYFSYKCFIFSLFYELCSVFFLTVTIDIFSCHLIIKVSTGKLQCRFYCVFFT